MISGGLEYCHPKLTQMTRKYIVQAENLLLCKHRMGAVVVSNLQSLLVQGLAQSKAENKWWPGQESTPPVLRSGQPPFPGNQGVGLSVLSLGISRRNSEGRFQSTLLSFWAPGTRSLASLWPSTPYPPSHPWSTQEGGPALVSYEAICSSIQAM